MKKSKSMLMLVLVLSSMALLAQNESEEVKYIPLIGDKAPKFNAKTTQGNITFPNDFKKNWKILFSHPQDFTPVCTSEILELCRYKASFDAMNVQFAVLSTDALDRHKSWIENMEKVEYKGMSNAKVDFPLIADPDLKISKKYGMIHPNSATTKDVRGVFIIDPQNNIRSILYYPMEVGRNFDEIQRTVTALQKHDNEKVLTPANWTAGKDVIVPHLTKNDGTGEGDSEIYSVTWYMHMRKDHSVATK